MEGCAVNAVKQCEAGERGGAGTGRAGPRRPGPGGRSSWFAWGMLVPLLAAVVMPATVVLLPASRPVMVILVVVEALLAGTAAYRLTRREADRGRGARRVRASGRCPAGGQACQERQRFARDIHDVLGFGLSAITLKTELASHLVDRDNGRARRELHEVLAIARQSIADVRAMTHGCHRMSLGRQVTAAREVLASAGIRVTTRVGGPPPDDRIDRELAIVLREAVTNLLRHSRARRCVIQVQAQGGRVRLSVSNDGAEPAGRRPGPTGSGLANLRLRMAGLDGSLVGYGHDGWYHLVADCPTGAPPYAYRSHPASRAIRTASSRLRALSLFTMTVR